jgi:alkylhydroperoxidase family enzyme
MPRVPYVPADIAEPREIVDAVRARRGGTLLDLDRMLLHSPELAAGWNAYLGAVRTKLTVPAKLRELAICGVAALNGADFEFVHHAPLLMEAGGTRAQVDALRDMDRAALDPGLFDAAERAVLALTIGMTRYVKVPNDTFREAQAALGSERAIVELVATIATYNMVSRFLVALDVQPEAEGVHARP